MPGNPYDGHTLVEALEQAAILSEVQPQIADVAAQSSRPSDT
jgi:IS5 family transposase